MIKWFGCRYGSKRPAIAYSFTSTVQHQRTRFDLNFRILWVKIIQILWMVRFSTLFCCTALTFKFFCVKWSLIPFCSYKIHFYINIHGYMNNKCIIIFGDTTHIYIYTYMAVSKKYLWEKPLHQWNPWTFSFIFK